MEAVGRIPANDYRLAVFWNDWAPNDACIRRYFKLRANLGEALTNGVRIENVPLLCSGDCRCSIQMGPVGDRGGIPRLVPCARTELADKATMTLHKIQHVSPFRFIFWDADHFR